MLRVSSEKADEQRGKKEKREEWRKMKTEKGLYAVGKGMKEGRGEVRIGDKWKLGRKVEQTKRFTVRRDFRSTMAFMIFQLEGDQEASASTSFLTGS